MARGRQARAVKKASRGRQTNKVVSNGISDQAAAEVGLHSSAPVAPMVGASPAPGAPEAPVVEADAAPVVEARVPPSTPSFFRDAANNFVFRFGNNKLVKFGPAMIIVENLGPMHLRQHGIIIPRPSIARAVEAAPLPEEALPGPSTRSRANGLVVVTQSMAKFTGKMKQKQSRAGATCATGIETSPSGLADGSTDVSIDSYSSSSSDSEDDDETPSSFAKRPKTT